MAVETREVLARGLVRLAAGVATMVLLLLLFHALAPALDGPVAVGISIGMAIAVSAIVEAKIWHVPLSPGFLLIRAVAAGLVAALVLSFLGRR